MNRRDFLQRAGIASATLSLWRRQPLSAHTAPSERRRTFEIVTRVEILKPAGVTRVWLPTPLADAFYQNTLGDTYQAGAGRVFMIEKTNEPDVLAAEWDEGVEPVLTLTSRVATTGHAANLKTPTVPPPLDLSPFAPYLHATRLIPIDGIVKTTAAAITRGAGTDFDGARAIYDWIVDNTFRDPKAVGCGLGDIRLMLETKNLGGKCADINALFVGLARASGIPARGVYGLRVAKSELGLRSLGLGSDEATKAQHCRAEVYLVGYGWVPVDPADVRKVILEEPPGNLTMEDEKVRSVRARLFGSWEMNWIAYNTAHDVILPGSKRGALAYFMYPVCETANGRLDSLDPAAFKYRITVREVE